MERFLFARVEVWLVALVLIFAGCGAVLFGTVVRNEAEARITPDRRAAYGFVGDMAFNLATVPKTLFKLATEREPRRARLTERFGDKPGGWTTYGGTLGLEGYLLLSRTDGDLGMAVAELVDLADFTTRHRWVPDPEALFAGITIADPITDVTHFRKTRFRIAHPYLFDDGSLIVRDHGSPMIRVDHCAEPIWRQTDTVYHHSVNVDAEGNLWSPSRVYPSPLGGHEFFNDHGIAKVSPEGELLFEKSLAEILLENDLQGMVFPAGGYMHDPLHLNDIEPALTDGPFWKKGDLFMSMRHKSLILQYRPSTNEVIWMKQGPWMAQHDVDFLDDTTIGVFNNNAYDRGAGWWIDGTSNLVTYDFATNEIGFPLGDASDVHQIKTLTEGLFEVLPTGHTLVEEENSGRILIFDADMALSAEFFNRASDGTPYRLGWSRFIPKETGDVALEAIAAAGECG